jgi:nitroreductase
MSKTGHMVKGSDVRKADHPVDALFLDRWSPRALSGDELTEAELMVLFEAARWAPSSYNNQPWRMLYARRGTEHWPRFFGLLVPANQEWARNAAVLVVFVSKTTFERNGKPSRTHSFDAGAAWENLALQATLKGYVAHGMEGFDYERARSELGIPADYAVEAMAAIGLPGDAASLPEKARKMEAPNDRRKLAETAFEGQFPVA